MAPVAVLKLDSAPCVGRLLVRKVIGSPSTSLPFRVRTVATLGLTVTVWLLATGGLLNVAQFSTCCVVIVWSDQHWSVPELWAPVLVTRNRQLPFRTLLLRLLRPPSGRKEPANGAEPELIGVTA